MQAQQRPAWRSRVWPVTGAVLLVLVLCLSATGATGASVYIVPTVVAVVAAATAAWAIRRTRADRRGYEARLTSWAASEAIVAERMRIARDLHDIVSHGLGLITVRAAAARLAADPAEARTALSDIETAGRGATAELRRMLTVLRTSDEAAPRLPIDDLDQLPSIVAGLASAGLRIDLEVAAARVSPGVQVAVCRTVREALHNAARHAGPSDVRVRVYRDGHLVVASVADTGPDGAGPSVPGAGLASGPDAEQVGGPGAGHGGGQGAGHGGGQGAGHGLIGLRERVTALGGTLNSGPADGGYRVIARIPDGVAG